MNNELLRLQAVRKFKELDEHIVVDLNEIVGLAAQICNTPIALVTLLDEDKQWFKATFGTELTCTDRKIAFCNHTIQQTEVLVVPDMLTDTRFNGKLVKNEQQVRFYAGAPLITKDGFALGTLCVINFEPANLDIKQINSLKVLAKQVVNLLELNWSLRSLEHQHQETQTQQVAIGKSEMKLKAIFDSSRDTHILVGKQLEVLAFNKSAAVFIRTTFNKKLCNGDNILQYTSPELLTLFSKYFNVALAGRSIKREWVLMPGTINENWKETSFIPVKDISGAVIGVALNSTDITTRKRHEEQIRVQNEALQRIAIIQSHELRRPVASLLGIMDLMRMENIDFSYFDIMELTVQELDEKIRGIVKDSEDTIQGRHLAIVA
ncbi:GAF domain-containing protein [Mucilaginibacter sp. FT3.2]|uniref:GAF domain-containing protein n=1 Tax=Mucilaginibacter sp. FT3.2 TaxID=2723090 RepID=UPI001617C89B|nr:GAF domain-containing protein [Mucilaginibacter sp. FT3.2]MBB6232055.1 PAS domain S-box-containing protein [Mucilaginibacter sp. FT3.2]